MFKPPLKTPRVKIEAGHSDPRMVYLGQNEAARCQFHLPVRPPRSTSSILVQSIQFHLPASVKHPLLHDGLPSPETSVVINNLALKYMSDAELFRLAAGPLGAGQVRRAPHLLFPPPEPPQPV